MESAVVHTWDIKSFFKNKFTLIQENRKLIIRFILMALFTALGIWFFKHKQAEPGKVKSVLLDSKWQYISLGIAVTLIYITLQGLKSIFFQEVIITRTILPHWLKLF